MPDRKFTLHNGGKPASTPKKRDSHGRQWFWALVSAVAGLSALGAAIHFTRHAQVEAIAQQKRQTTCLIWEDQGKTQVQCGGKLFVEKPRDRK